MNQLHLGNNSIVVFPLAKYAPTGTTGIIVGFTYKYVSFEYTIVTICQNLMAVIKYSINAVSLFQQMAS